LYFNDFTFVCRIIQENKINEEGAIFMQKGVFDNDKLLMESLYSNGVFLITGVDKPNIMTIGWATIGIIWRKPVMTVMVRPSRYSYELINSHPEFTVSIPEKNMSKELVFCGSRSGRDADKFNECNFTPEKSIAVKVPGIKECNIHYECRIVHVNKVIPENLDNKIIKQLYNEGDFHKIYFGEILGVFKKR